MKSIAVFLVLFYLYYVQEGFARECYSCQGDELSVCAKDISSDPDAIVQTEDKNKCFAMYIKLGRRNAIFRSYIETKGDVTACEQLKKDGRKYIACVDCEEDKCNDDTEFWKGK